MNENKNTPQELKSINVWIEEDEDLTVRPVEPGFFEEIGFSTEELEELKAKEAQEEKNQPKDK